MSLVHFKLQHIKKKKKMKRAMERKEKSYVTIIRSRTLMVSRQKVLISIGSGGGESVKKSLLENVSKVIYK